MHILRGHQGSIRGLCYAPDGRRLASASEDGTVRIWDISSKAEPLVLPNPGGGVEALTFLPDGQRLLAGTAGGQLVLWDALTGESLVSVHVHERGVRHLACAPDRALVVSAGWDRTLKLWDLGAAAKRLSKVEPLPWDTDVEVGALAFRSPSVLAAGRAYPVQGEEAGLRFLDLDTKKWEEVAFDENDVRAMAFSSDGRWALVSDPGYAEFCCELDTEKRLTFPEPGCILAAAFLPDSDRVLTCGADGLVRLYALGDALREIRAYSWHGDWVTCLAVSPGGMTAASGSEDRTIVVWDLSDL